MEEMRKGFYEYKVEYWDEFGDEDHPDGQMVIHYGICYASTFAKAVKKIEKSYDYIENIEVHGVEPSGCYDLKFDPYFLAGKALEKGVYCNV